MVSDCAGAPASPGAASGRSRALDVFGRDDVRVGVTMVDGVEIERTAVMEDQAAQSDVVCFPPEQRRGKSSAR